MSSLPILIFLPLLAAFAHRYFNRTWALAISLIPLALLLFGNHDSVAVSWIPTLSIAFSLKMDGVSQLFLYLTSIIIPIVVFTAKEKHPYGWIFLTQGLLSGFFLANDLVLFTLFWESMLLPLFFFILLYGGADRQKAALKFIVYMLVGSCLLIAAILGLYFYSSPHTFAMDQIAVQQGASAHWVLAIFLLAFAVKTPLFPFHAWLPDAYTEASTSGTILLSALLSKAGIYGIYRIGYGYFPDMMTTYSVPLLTLAIIGVLYGGFIAWRQTDFKRLMAYSSFSHVNFLLAGLFATETIAHKGALLQVFNHGVTITALFLLCSYLAERLSSTSLNAAGGLAAVVPRMAWCALFFTLASVALPGTSNFVGEVLILFGVFVQNYWMAAILALTMILSAVYMLRFQHTVFFGPLKHPSKGMLDLSSEESFTFFILILLILAVGLYPAVLLSIMGGLQ